jgi:hypothetical protein
VRTAPASLLLVLLACLAAQIGWRAAQPVDGRASAALPAPPSSAALRLAAFDEPAAASRMSMLYVQGFDMAAMDYGRLAGWLRTALELDPRSGYPLFAAARVFAETPDPARMRAMLEFIHEQFMAAPDRRWPALAHAALLAKHRLKDLPLARKYAVAVATHTKPKGVPLWARQMEVFILEDMNELEAAKIMLGGLLERGEIRSPRERRLMLQRLKEMEQRLAR